MRSFSQGHRMPQAKRRSKTKSETQAKKHVQAAKKNKMPRHMACP